MKLKKTVYETIGTITMEEDKVHYAEIIDCTIFDLGELAKMRAFLDEVEKAMISSTQMNEVEDAPVYTVSTTSWGNGCCEPCVMKDVSCLECIAQKAMTKTIDNIAERVNQMNAAIDNTDWRKELIRATGLKDEAEVREKLGIEYVDGAWKTVVAPDCHCHER